ncbi:MAG: hypothetical protein J6R91_00060 [Bacteroidaceae bacterium]|nr:hypothetical protein [Bacteroidaceae bacterium]
MKFLMKAIPYRWVHIAAVLLLYVFCTWAYGDVFHRAQQYCYVSTSAEQMVYVSNLPWGDIYWVLRFLMLPFKSIWLGGAWMTLWLVGSACLLARALRLSRKWKPLTFLLPILTLSYLVFRGIRVYYHDEPSMVIGLPILVTLVCGLCALAGHFALKKRQHETKSPMGVVLALGLSFVLLFVSTDYFRQNDVLTARLQNMMWQAEWEDMEKEALSARRPTRAVAAYYAIALQQQGKLLEKLFNLPFDYPEDNNYLVYEGKTEYSLFEGDANFHAGLINSSYRAVMEQHVMVGPTIAYYKRMAMCAILNQEKALAERYLFALEGVPFESDFVEKWRAYLVNPSLMNADQEIVNVLALKPLEENLEQNYRRPIFMGYNVGLSSGSNYTLITSVAATLYSKELMRLLNVAGVMRQKLGGRLPQAVREAILIKSVTLKDVAQVFPDIANDRILLAQFQSFVKEAQPYLDDKPKLREVMKEKWLGTYFYYYYCENNNPNQVRRQEQNNVGVN